MDKQWLCGKPAFIQDPVNFWRYSKNEIIQFGLEIDDPILYPFGKAFMKVKLKHSILFLHKMLNIP